jgi:hypothetical protein
MAEHDNGDVILQRRVTLEDDGSLTFSVIEFSPSTALSV